MSVRCTICYVEILLESVYLFYMQLNVTGLRCTSTVRQKYLFVNQGKKVGNFISRMLFVARA